jgi:alkylation response protein AidB-like acyl-CoA dehydrogenase
MQTAAIREGDQRVAAPRPYHESTNRDLVIVAGERTWRGHSGDALLVKAGDGLERGCSLEKMIGNAQDTTELTSTTRAGSEPDRGEARASPLLTSWRRASPRLGRAAAHARTASGGRRLPKERHAFRKLQDVPANRFKHAEMWTELEIAQLAADRQVEALNAGELTPVEAAMTKWWTTELNKRVLDGCLQLHGGYGYTEEYPIARAWRDGRVMTIYGGTTEIMKEIVGRSLGI